MGVDSCLKIEIDKSLMLVDLRKAVQDYTFVGSVHEKDCHGVNSRYVPPIVR
jgi:hypothetical protein